MLGRGTLPAASSNISITLPPSFSKTCGRSFFGVGPTPAMGHGPITAWFDGTALALGPVFTVGLGVQLMGSEGVPARSWNPCGPVVVEEATGMATQGPEREGKGQVREVWESKWRGAAMWSMGKHTTVLACGRRRRGWGKEKSDSPSIVFRCPSLEAL
jgi:hypothetical protein